MKLYIYAITSTVTRSPFPILQQDKLISGHTYAVSTCIRLRLLESIKCRFYKFGNCIRYLPVLSWPENGCTAGGQFTQFSLYWIFVGSVDDNYAIHLYPHSQCFTRKVKTIFELFRISIYPFQTWKLILRYCRRPCLFFIVFLNFCPPLMCMYVFQINVLVKLFVKLYSSFLRIIWVFFSCIV